jgi:hypothetical protein
MLSSKRVHLLFLFLKFEMKKGILTKTEIQVQRVKATKTKPGGFLNNFHKKSFSLWSQRQILYQCYQVKELGTNVIF